MILRKWLIIGRLIVLTSFDLSFLHSIPSFIRTMVNFISTKGRTTSLDECQLVISFWYYALLKVRKVLDPSPGVFQKCKTERFHFCMYADYHCFKNVRLLLICFIFHYFHTYWRIYLTRIHYLFHMHTYPTRIEIGVPQGQRVGNI